MKKPIAFSFVLDELFSIHPTVKPMFGCHAIYHGEKIVLITRNKPEHAYDNGVWVATTPEHHDSLKSEFPSLRSINLFGSKETAWQNIPAEADDFEEAVLKACAHICKGDKRIGKIPKAKKRKKS
ncbi:MAG: hypothetical protein KF725_00865 [Cyclobacteriaceae bacterium]|nr:hypothetical protein [Cyclobacteriaceae bacterium]UYN86990.1 MAG: hypothetical protein KIT51_01540 [Cyclobacteriaceae bacterium]